MDAQRSSGAPVQITIGGKDRLFSRLSRRDVCDLISGMPAGSEGERRWYNEYDLHRWATTPEGCVTVLAKASGEIPEEVEKWGSIVSKTTAAGIVVAESCLTGEEPDAVKGNNNSEGEYCPDFPETSSRKPGSSQNTRRGWAILGRLLPPYGTRRLSESAKS